jgi:hypothetical protein
LRHVGGHEETATFSLGLDLSGGKSNMQGYASSTSFGQRYCTKLLLNLVFEGDDDNGAKGELTFINPDQIAEITKLVNETETDPKTFLEWVFGDEETHNYAEIPEAKFVAVVNALKGKLRRIKMEAGAKKDG